MLQLSKLTDYAIVIMAYLATRSEGTTNARHIAQKTGIALPTTSKLLKRLAQEQLLLAQRGMKGGYQLALPATDIPLGKIIQALEGQIALTECSYAQHQCVVEKQCTIRQGWHRISRFIEDTLFHISVADLIQPLKLEPLLKRPEHYLENTP
jgi:FeS assembly SUF system regulator